MIWPDIQTLLALVVGQIYDQMHIQYATGHHKIRVYTQSEAEILY